MDRSPTVPNLTSKAPSCSLLSAKDAHLLKRSLLALSLANLCYLFVWSEILRVGSEKAVRYFLAQPPDPAFLWAIVVDVVVLSVVILLLLSLYQRENSPLKLSSKVVLALISLFALYQLWLSANASFYGVLGERNIIIFRLAVIGLLLVFLLRTRRRALLYLRKVAFILAPLFFIFLVQGLWTYYGPASRRLGPGHAAGLLPASRSGARVIWIIFDELDSRLLFENRPARIHTPHFNALREHSLFADHVKSPARNTISAIPSLLLAKRIPQDDDIDLDIRPVAVRFDGCSQFTTFRSQPNIFRRVRALGINTAVSGWYHPYCRMFRNDLSACASAVGAETSVAILQELLRDRPIYAKAAYLTNWQARQLPFNQRLHWISPMPGQAAYLRQILINKLEFVLQNGERMLQDRKLQFVFLHIPSPHPPGIWNTRKDTFTTSNQANYADNLELADMILGRIRRILEETGDWDRATILVSSDHPYRPDHWLVNGEVPPSPEMIRLTQMQWQPYIPFFLKLPGQRTGSIYHRKFNSVLSADLLLDTLEDKIQTPAQALKWLDDHAAASEERVCR
jgi:hypothetical protein